MPVQTERLKRVTKEEYESDDATARNQKLSVVLAGNSDNIREIRLERHEPWYGWVADILR